MKKLLLALSLFCCTATTFADTGVAIGRGFNGVSGLDGFGLHLKKYWGTITNVGSSYQLTGLWDFGLAYWHTSKAQGNEKSDITVLSAVPVFRLQRSFAYDNGIAPFVDLGYGIALFNHDTIVKQNLGGYGNFLLTAGFGINFGRQSQYDVSYHYLNYNNAGQFKHDDGMFINSISFTYRFGN